MKDDEFTKRNAPVGTWYTLSMYAQSARRGLLLSAVML
jgi:hypothetical protein